jgi:hypothetical protein
MWKFFQENQEHNPTDTTCYLHNIGSKDEVYDKYVESMAERYHITYQPISKPHFLLMWNTYYRHIKPSNKHGFGRCNTCSFVANNVKIASTPEEHGASLGCQ